MVGNRCDGFEKTLHRPDAFPGLYVDMKEGLLADSTDFASSALKSQLKCNVVHGVFDLWYRRRAHRIQQWLPQKRTKSSYPYSRMHQRPTNYDPHLLCLNVPSSSLISPDPYAKLLKR